MDTKTDELLKRVILGNTRLYEAWERACQSDTDEGYESQMLKIDRAFPRLDSLCQELIATGYQECLYGGSRFCNLVPASKRFCFVCPSKFQESLGQVVAESELPRASQAPVRQKEGAPLASESFSMPLFETEGVGGLL